MGSLFSAPKVQTPPPPPEPKDYNVVDKVSGTKQTVVTGADGNKTVVIENDYTPEQQAEIDNLKRLGEQSLAKYESLVNDPFLDTMPEYKAQIDRLFGSQQANLSDAFATTTRESETALARFGVDDSTAGTQLRAENNRNYLGAKQQLADDKINTINSVRQQEMANQLGMYGLASGRQDTMLAQGMQTLGLGTQIAANNAARNDSYQNNLYNSRLGIAAANQQAKSQNQAMWGQLIGTAAGFAIGGPAGAGVGGKMGSGLSGGSSSYYPQSGLSVNWARQ